MDCWTLAAVLGCFTLNVFPYRMAPLLLRLHSTQFLRIFSRNSSAVILAVMVKPWRGSFKPEGDVKFGSTVVPRYTEPLLYQTVLPGDGTVLPGDGTPSIPRIFEKKRCLGMAGCNHSIFKFSLRFVEMPKFWPWPKAVQKMMCWKKIFKKISGRPFRRLPKAKDAVPVGAKKNGAGPKCLELWMRKLCMHALFFFFFGKKLPRLL